MVKSIKLSKEHGLNPSVEVCNCCGKEMGIALFGDAYKEDGVKKEAPRFINIGNLCDECKSVIKAGNTYFIEVKDGESGDNPYRTGRLVAVKNEAVNRLFGNCAPINFMTHSDFENCFGDALKDK